MEYYSNAFEYAHHIDPSLTYVEGFASRWHEDSWWFDGHAWCVDNKERVIDPTWRAQFGNIPIEQWRYFGIPFETSFVSRLAGKLHRNESDTWTFGILTPDVEDVIEAHLAARDQALYRRPDAAFLADFANSPALHS
jgi:hypothetical protein